MEFLGAASNINTFEKPLNFADYCSKILIMFVSMEIYSSNLLVV
jgi:hypothetical protein